MIPRHLFLLPFFATYDIHSLLTAHLKIWMRWQTYRCWNICVKEQTRRPSHYSRSDLKLQRDSRGRLQLKLNSLLNNVCETKWIIFEWKTRTLYVCINSIGFWRRYNTTRGVTSVPDFVYHAKSWITEKSSNDWIRTPHCKMAVDPLYIVRWMKSRNQVIFNPLNTVVIWGSICFNIIKYWILPAQCICVYRWIFTVKPVSFANQHEPVAKT
jgi:hypothetical protein